MVLGFQTNYLILQEIQFQFDLSLGVGGGGMLEKLLHTPAVDTPAPSGKV